METSVLALRRRPSASRPAGPPAGRRGSQGASAASSTRGLLKPRADPELALRSAAEGAAESLFAHWDRSIPGPELPIPGVPLLPGVGGAPAVPEVVQRPRRELLEVRVVRRDRVGP